jgi:tetratricopeptide (TPR) repeat protein
MRARLGRAPDDNDARELLATVLGETEEASELATTALTADPERASRHLILAMALGSRKVAEATAHARRALELAPGYPAAFPTLAALLLYEQDFAEAATVAREGLANDPLNKELHLALAIALVHTDQAGEGAAQLGMVVALTPNNPQVRAQVAGLFQVMGQTQSAITQFKEALRLDAYSGEALNGLAWIRAAHPDPQFRDGVEAVALAERACEGTGYQQPLLVRTLAAGYAEAGRFEEAVTTAGKARDLALAAGQPEEAAKIAELISAFRAGKAWRENVGR